MDPVGEPVFILFKVPLVGAANDLGADNPIRTTLRRFSDKGFFVEWGGINVSYARAREHYIEHKDQPFYGRIVSQLAGCKRVVVARLVPRARVGGTDPIPSNAIARKMVGPTDPELAPPGTIRGDFALQMEDNFIHCSDSAESAEREIAMWNADVVAQNLLVPANC
jgi:nucleoside-diphosphate kinase